MTVVDVARLAAAIAKVNGHSEPEDWAEKVVKEWEAQQPATPAPGD